MLFNKYLNDNYNRFLEYSYNIRKNSNDNPKDILQECLMYLLELPENKKKSLLSRNYIDFYLIKMIYLSYFSKKSKYQCKYNRIIYDKNIENMDYFKEDDNEIIDDYDIRLKLLYNILLTKCTYYEQQVFLQYHNKHKSFLNFQKATGIDDCSLWRVYNKVLKIIKDNLYLLKNNE